ncbi:uncharacterized protein LOC122526187 isoform X5 [Polistes fuscatus]|uniref:uncharacterized protein LOC122526187 isoform X5 n=1 Tax=Polistes fuscatus TaxID=30207 RepID=UPI001CA8C2FA|nr:uncharacterized protein LOC122526187 isoform X5 [Polistes fuscatus]
MNYIDLSKNLSAFVKACSNLGYLTAVNNAGRRVQRNRCSSLRSSAARGIARSATCCSLSITFPLPCTNHFVRTFGNVLGIIEKSDTTVRGTTGDTNLFPALPFIREKPSCEDNPEPS